MSAHRGQAGAPPVHALGRARLGQLRPGPDDATSARASTRSGNLTAFEFTHFGIPYYSTQPAQQQVTGQRRRVRDAPGRAEATISGSQYSIPNWQRDRQEPAAAEQLLQGVVPAGAATTRSRRSRPSRPSTSWPTWRRWTRSPSGSRTSRNLTGRSARSGGRTCSRTSAKDANWQAKVAASNLSSANVVKGRGIAFGFYSNTMTCCVADIDGEQETGKIVAKELHVAGDAGLIVYPAGSENNEEGAAMQGLSRALVRAGRLRQEGRHEPRLGHAIR